MAQRQAPSHDCGADRACSSSRSQVADASACTDAAAANRDATITNMQACSTISREGEHEGLDRWEQVDHAAVRPATSQASQTSTSTSAIVARTRADQPTTPRTPSLKPSHWCRTADSQRIDLVAAVQGQHHRGGWRLQPATASSAVQADPRGEPDAATMKRRLQRASRVDRRGRGDWHDVDRPALRASTGASQLSAAPAAPVSEAPKCRRFPGSTAHRWESTSRSGAAERRRRRGDDAQPP